LRAHNVPFFFCWFFFFFLLFTGYVSNLYSVSAGRGSNGFRHVYLGKRVSECMSPAFTRVRLTCSSLFDTRERPAHLRCWYVL
jgi:hypothetical protein